MLNVHKEEHVPPLQVVDLFQPKIRYQQAQRGVQTYKGIPRKQKMRIKK